MVASTYAPHPLHPRDRPDESRRAAYEFPDRASLDAAAGGEEMKRLIRDFDRDWPEVKRTRDILVQAESWPG